MQAGPFVQRVRCYPREPGLCFSAEEGSKGGTGNYANGDAEVSTPELYRHNADDCRQRSLRARTPADKANWLKIAEEWQKLAEEVDLAAGLTVKSK